MIFTSISSSLIVAYRLVSQRFLRYEVKYLGCCTLFFNKECLLSKSELILSTSYFPPISYFWLLHNYKAFIEVHENYQKRSIRNKAQIAGANGRMSFSVPLKKGKSQLPLAEVEISYDEPWPKQHLSHIQSAYGSAPYFEYYYPQIERLLNSNQARLLTLNLEILRLFKSFGYLSGEIYLTEDFKKPGLVKGLDLRKYSGKEIPTELFPYNQVFEYKYGFLSDLSCLDLLFNLGPEAPSYIKSIKA